MYVILLAGGIASGKSTVSHLLRDRGACVIDLDVLSREANERADVLDALSEAFGSDVVDASTGALRRELLAQRAFADAQATKRLEAIMHPAIRALLAERLQQAEAAGEQVVVIEVPLLDRVEDLIATADEVLVVACPVALRRERAVARGMDAADFDRRVARQASDAQLLSYATTILTNDADQRSLVDQVDAWWRERAKRGWKRT